MTFWEDEFLKEPTLHILHFPNQCWLWGYSFFWGGMFLFISVPHSESQRNYAQTRKLSYSQLLKTLEFA